MRKPWLILPASWLHFLSPLALKIYSRIKSNKPCKWRSFHWKHIYFPNPLGTAGGVDKNALYIKDWWSLGAGFVEVGTVTPKAQKANPAKILDRNLKHLSLWNNMGFPNKGLDFMKEQLSSLPQKKASPVFVNIGKNRDTDLSKTDEDYKKSLEILHPFADAFVINISSPNTKDLREIFRVEHLFAFLKSLKDKITILNPKIPLILKISPDETELFRVLDQSIEAGIDGWCFCNTTRERAVPHLFPEHGGISGKLLSNQSLNLLKKAKKYLKEKAVEDKLIISCGGILTVQDVLKRLEEGAHLVQVYSALVFKGPGFFQSISKQISKTELC